MGSRMGLHTALRGDYFAAHTCFRRLARLARFIVNGMIWLTRLAPSPRYDPTTRRCGKPLQGAVADKARIDRLQLLQEQF